MKIKYEWTVRHWHNLLVLWCTLLIPLVSSQLCFPLLLLGKPLKPLVHSFHSLPEHQLISLVPGGFVEGIQFILEKFTGSLEGIPQSPVIPCLLWTSGLFMFFCIYFAVCLICGIGGGRARKSGCVADVESNSQKWSWADTSWSCALSNICHWSIVEYLTNIAKHCCWFIKSFFFHASPHLLKPWQLDNWSFHTSHPLLYHMEELVIPLGVSIEGIEWDVWLLDGLGRLPAGKFNSSQGPFFHDLTLSLLTSRVPSSLVMGPCPLISLFTMQDDFSWSVEWTGKIVTRQVQSNIMPPFHYHSH